MDGRSAPPSHERTSTIFMPLITDPPGGPAAEDRDYRPVEGERLAGDIYRVVSVQPENERWEYPSGATVFAVRLHAGDDVTVIVAPVSDADGGPDDGPAARRPPRRREPRKPRALRRAAKRAARFRPRLPRAMAQGARSAQILLMMVVIVATGFAWSGRDIYVYIPLQPADPIRASVVVSSAILIAGLWRARDAHALRALRVPCALVGAAFALSVLAGRYQL